MSSIHRASMHTGPRLFREQDADDPAWFEVKEPGNEAGWLRAHVVAFWSGDGR